MSSNCDAREESDHGPTETSILDGGDASVAHRAGDCVAAGVARLVTPFAPMRSAPLDPPERGRIAVKIVTAIGMEMTAVREVD